GHLRKEAATAAEYYNVQRKILGQVKASAAAQVSSEQSLIREEMNTLVSSVQFDLAYADLQNAFAAVYTSLGADPYEEPLSSAMGIDEIATILRSAWRKRGDLDG
ncbi:MAG: TolC family protein, partial [Notoacmeibacter sp.]|nr:TolC family protein [Notoacmeibacter sp.]